MRDSFEKYILSHGNKVFQSFQAWHRGEACLRQGLAKECLSIVSPAIECSIKHHERLYLIELLAVQAKAQMALGDMDGARAGLESAFSTAQVLDMIPGQITIAAQLLDFHRQNPGAANGSAYLINKGINHLKKALVKKDINCAPKSLKEKIDLLLSK